VDTRLGEKPESITWLRKGQIGVYQGKGYGGVPIPAFYCKSCGKEIITEETINKVKELFLKEGSNAWFSKNPEEILGRDLKCPHCGSSIGFEKETDTMDVWFDSGISHFASFRKQS